MAENVTVEVTQTGEVEVTVNTDAATIAVGTTTTGNAGTNASVTNSGTSSAAVFNFTIPRGDTGAAGPNSVTSATSSDGTGVITFASVGSPIVKATTSAGVSARTNGGTECFSWGAGNGQNFTFTAGTGVAFNATSYTFGTGAATAMKTALAISSEDITFNSAIEISGANSTLSTTGASASIYTTGASASIYTTGENALISTEGNSASIFTSGATANIYTESGFIATGSTFQLNNSTYITTLSHAPSDDRAIEFPDASGNLALCSSATGEIVSADITDATFENNPATIVKRDELSGTINVGGINVEGAFGGISASQSISTDTVFQIRNNTYVLALSTTLAGANRAIVFPDASGTVALTSDITVTPTNTVTLTNKTLTNPTVTDFTESTVSIGNSGTTQTIALTSGTFQTVTLTGNCTFTMPTATAGKSFILKVLTGAGGFTATFTGVKWSGAITPTITTTASRYDLISFIADGTAWSGSAIQNFTP